MKSIPAVVISFRLRPDQRKRLREIARKRGLSLSELYRRALDEIILRDGEISATANHVLTLPKGKP